MSHSHLKTKVIENPFKRRRVWLGLKQDELARRASVTRQTVTELEAGLYRKPPESVLRCLTSSQTDEDRLRLDYASWVALMRRENTYLFVEDYGVRSFNDYVSLIGNDSLRGFCRALVIQRSLVQGYLSNGGNWESIENCLWSAGLSSDFTTFLKGLPRS